MVERDDIEFESLLSDKRHKELKNALKSILVAVSKSDDSGIKEALLKHSDEIKSLGINISKSISNIPKTENNNDEVIKSVTSLENKIKSLLSIDEEILGQLKIMNMPKESSVDFNRNHGGYLQSPVTITTKIKT